ncbi:MAG: uroporphyrinogen decarboxylase family protein, partial [Candidatus Bathyarchaeia archaeon]
TLFTLATPREVEDYCKKLIDICGQDGGFVLSSGCEVPLNAKLENIRAMINTAKTHGVYRK